MSALLLGLLFGLQHATDPDHVLAVATIVSRARRFRAGALIGLCWGVGHTATVAAVGVAMVSLQVTLAPGAVVAAELLVALLLMLLGALRIAGTLRESDPVPFEHLTEPHRHPGTETFHSHRHAHGAVMHRHPHVHPPAWLARVLDEVGPARAVASALVGLVHGLAGSGVVAVLVAPTVGSPSAVAAYLALFGIGTIVGMTALTAVLSAPFTLGLPGLGRWRRRLALGTGAACLAFGLYLGVQAALADGLLQAGLAGRPR